MIVGIVALARKWKIGFILGMLGSGLWAVKAYYTGQMNLLFIEALIVVLHGIAFVNWFRMERKDGVT